MTITDVTVERYSWPKPKPIRNGKYIYSTVGLNLVKVHTGDGLEGIGWAGGTAAGRPGEIVSALVEHYRQALIGEDPFDYRRHWDAMWEPKIVGRRGVSTQVLSAIDIAIWDLMGKILNKPVHKLLGGYTVRIPTYIAGGYYEEGKGLRELAREMEENLELGARAVKIKIGGVPVKEEVQEKLMQIANDFFDDLGLDGADVVGQRWLVTWWRGHSGGVPWMPPSPSVRKHVNG